MRLSLAKRLLFSVVAVALGIALLEGVLALAGFKAESYFPDPYVGFESTSKLFVDVPGNEQPAMLQTDRSRLQLFNDQQFTKKKAKGVFRVFSMGGSTTYGRPYQDETSFNGWMRAYLERMGKEGSYEWINAGGVSYASYRVAKLMEELVQYEPDLFVIYTGHNEFLEERIYHNVPKVPSALKGWTRAAKQFRSATLVKQWVFPFTEAGKQDAKAAKLLKGEVHTILDRSMGPEAYTRDKQGQAMVLEHFRFNLHRMLDIADSVQAKVLLVLPSGNLRDVSPFKSEFDPSLSEADRLRWRQYYDQARASFGRQDPKGTFQALAQAEAIDPLPASLHFVKARALEATGQYEKAKAAYVRAKDEDVCPLRALKQVPQLITEVARERGVPVVDFIKLQESQSKHEIPGASVFLDHVHPTIESHRLLGLEILRSMEQQGWIALDWNPSLESEVKESVLSGLDRKAHGVAMMNLAKVLGWAGKREEAHRAALKSLELDPDNAHIQFQAGLAAFMIHQSEDAMTHYQQALAINPQHVGAHCNLGAMLEDQGDFEAAIKHFECALKYGTEATRERDQSNLASARQKWAALSRTP